MKNHYDEEKLNLARQNFDRTLKLLNEIFETDDKQKRYDLSIHLVFQFDDLLSYSFLTIYDNIKAKLFENNGGRSYMTSPEYRNYLAFLIENGFPLAKRDQEKVTRGLLALNKGETQTIFQPETLGLKGPAYTLARLQSLAMIHVNVLHGWGLKKGEARLRVAAAYGYGENVETIRSWEGKAVKEFLGEERANEFAETSFLLGHHNKARQLDGILILEGNSPDNKQDSKSTTERVSAWEEMSSRTEDELFDLAFPEKKDEKSIRYRRICSLNACVRKLPLTKCGSLYIEALNGQDIDLGIHCPV